MTAADPHEIRRALEILAPAGVFEIRAPKAKLNGGRPGTAAGYFDDHAAATAAAAKLSGTAPGVYITLNPVGPALLARAANRVDPHAERTTGDAEITERRWLLLDFDPERAAGISSSDSEHAAALERATTMRAWLHERGWPAPVYADSGNGAHLLYRVDLPNDNETKKLIEAALKTLASRFDDDRVKIDTGVFNASRISKIYGTTACKGDPLPDRPHRMARILESPITLFPVDLRLLHALVPAPAARPAAPRPSAPTPADFFGRVNARAMAALSAWVPALLPAAVPYHDGFRVKSAALGRPLEEDLSITPVGIVDFGVHDQGDPSAGKRTPIDLVLEHGRQTDATEAAMWLCRTMGIDPPALGWNAPRGRKPQLAESGAATVEPAALQKDENHFSDYGNVVKLMERLSGGIAYTPGLDWLLYNPDTGIWEPEPGSERVKRMALETLRDAWGEILQGAQSDESDLKKKLKELDSDDPTAAMIGKRLKLATSYRERVFGWMMQCETAYRIRSTLEIAEGYFWTAPDVWDSNAHILVCANGVLDLATGALLPHSPDFRATKTTGTDYRPGAMHSAWDAAVSLLKSEGDRYTFIQQFCGSGLHGANPNERVVIFQGDGGTGKGTLLTAIHHALGDYVATVEVGSLLATDWRKQNKSAPREDLLKLRGARFVYPSIEPPKDSKLDDGSIKALTGNDAITARYPHGKNSITFTPVFKLAIQTNFPLQTEFDDPGMKRRVIVVPFNQKPEKPDPAIKHDLMHDPNARAAVLAWLYEGYRAWLKNGFALPVSTLATQATADYWADMNPYEQFARDVGLRFGKGLKCLKPRITGAFKAWRDETGRRDAASKDFPRWLGNMGCQEGWEGKDRMWFGVDFLHLPRSPLPPPPVSENNTVEIQYSNSTTNFHETDRGNGGDRGKAPQSPSVDAKPAGTEEEF